MLPFLKPKTQSGSMTVIERKPDTKPETSDESGLSMAAKDLISAIQSNDSQGVAEALRAAFQILDSEPHEEGQHLETEGE